MRRRSERRLATSWRRASGEGAWWSSASPQDLVARLAVLLDLGLGYLTLERSTPTLSPGELQRLRLATQVRSNLFGVVYVLDEPSAGLHPADTEALLRALDRLKAVRQLAVRRRARARRDPPRRLDRRRRPGRRRARRLRALQRAAGRAGDDRAVADAAPPVRRHALPAARRRARRAAGCGCAASRATTCTSSTSAFPLGVFTTVTGVSGSGKSSLVSQVLVELVADAARPRARRRRRGRRRARAGAGGAHAAAGSRAAWSAIKRLVRVDQKPIGRTPRSNLATYTGLFDHVRKLFAATKAARARRYDAGRFSFNVAKGRCETCEGEGFVMVELLFLPASTRRARPATARATTPRRSRSQYRGKNIADVLGMTVDAAWEFFADEPQVRRVARRAARGRPRLPAARASRRPSCRAARRSASSSPPSCSARSAATRSTCSTSRPPACTRPTSRS